MSCQKQARDLVKPQTNDEEKAETWHGDGSKNMMEKDEEEDGDGWSEDSWLIS